MVNFLEMKITRSNKVVRDWLDYKTCQTWETLNMLSVPKTRPLFEPVDFPHTFLFWRNETLTWNFRSFNFLLCDVTVWSGRGWTFSGLASEESSMSFIFSLSWPNVHTWGGGERASALMLMELPTVWSLWPITLLFQRCKGRILVSPCSSVCLLFENQFPVVPSFIDVRHSQVNLWIV